MRMDAPVRNTLPLFAEKLYFTVLVKASPSASRSSPSLNDLKLNHITDTTARASSSFTSSSASSSTKQQSLIMETFETLSGAAFINMDHKGITALSRDALLRLVFRSKAIVTAIATLSTDTHSATTVNHPLSVAHILNMEPKEIVAALSEREKASSSTSTSSSVLPSEPLPWRPNTRPKLQPGALLDIDQGPMYDILTEWLRIEDICHLISALCQKRRRAEFLTLVSTSVLLFNREEIHVLTDSYGYNPFGKYEFTHRALGLAALLWVLKRGINLASLHLPRDVNSNKKKHNIRESVFSLALNGRLDKLETIILYGCSYINDADLAAVISKCYKSAKSIDIRGCGLSESAAAHIKRCTKLEAFAAKGNESVADMKEIIQACRKIRKMDFSGFSDRLNDEVLLSMADNCHFLEHLTLGYYSDVSDAAVRRVAESCPLLQYVDLQNTRITDATVVALCSRCPLMKRMFLAECHNLTDAAVLAVAERLPGLTYIDLSYITAITSSAVETLASKCRELEYINLGCSLNVCDVSLSKIAECCSKLRELHVYETAVTAAVLAKVAINCSKLKTVYFDDEFNASLSQIFPHVDWR